MKTAILIIVLLTSINLNAGLLKDDWTTFNTVNEISFLWLTFVDLNQTLTFTRKGQAESNPFLGEYPSERKVKVMVIGAMVLHPVLSYCLPKDIREYWQGMTVAWELNAVYQNYNKGISANIMCKF